uniref:GTPase RsgA n=1 Tax=uncultured Desulfovibrio sp. TaxID=167968 RepID=UPI002636E715
MNKAFIGILIAVCILGMALIMLNEWKSSRSEPETAPSTLEPAPSAPGELPPNTGSSLTPPVPSEVTAPASSETAAAGGQPPAAAPAPTPSSEALERGFAFNDTEAAAPQGEGLEAVRELLAGRTTLVAGNSGVGKSTLIRAIDPSLDIRTGEISESH